MPTYDVVVVGAGAAGAPVAARLSEDPHRNVLLIEAGPAPTTKEGFPDDLLDAALMTGAMPGHPHNWAFVGNLTPELPYSIARGKILGGSTALNGTYYIRGRRKDFDTYAELGNPEWSFDKVLPYFRKLENDLTYGDTDLHGGDGPVPIYRVKESEQTEYTKAFIAACKELGYAWEEDKNGQEASGIGPLPMNAVDGVRMNTGITYVLPAMDRPNFTVKADTLARRVVFDGLTVRGVEVERGGKIEVIEAKEVVLSAGAFKSPHVLALSGIGPKAELNAAGIPVVVDLPGVGKNFSDHPDITLNWSPKRRLDSANQRDAFQYVLNYNSEGTKYEGDLEILPTIRPMAVMMGMEQGKRFSTVLDVIKRPKATLASMKGVSIKRFVQQLQHSNDLGFAIAVQQEESRGTIATVSSDPKVYPKIEYNYLDHDSDRRRMREVVRATVRILHSEAFKPIFRRITEIDEKTLQNDAKLDAWMKTHLATAIHAAGSCRMGNDPDDGAVVDQYGRVHGVTGLRVADTSILPFAPSRGPAATTIMIGERMAGLMTSGPGAISEPTAATGRIQNA